MSMRLGVRRLFLLAGWMFVMAAGASLPVRAAPPDPTPTPSPAMDMGSFQDRLAPPPTVIPPTQADQGAQVYYLVCMVCHGDRGQGLTEEWRNVLPPPDNNCWGSGCHGVRIPPEGFKLPRSIPSIVGPQVPARFTDAQQLHDFLKSSMPWQRPGMLKDEEYWQLTAFVMRLNGRDPGSYPLNIETASNFAWSGVKRPPLAPQTVALYVVVTLAVVAVVVVVGMRFIRSRKIGG